MNALTLAREMLVIFLLMLLGYYARRRGFVPAGGVKSVSALVTNICAPAMVLDAAFSSEAPLPLPVFAAGFGVSALIFALLIAAGALICRLLRAARAERYSYQLPTVFGNIGFIGYPVCLAVLGKESLIYASMCNLVYNLLLYTYGKHMLVRAAQRDDAGPKPGRLAALRPLVNVGTLSSLAALIIFLTDPPTPPVVSNVLNYAGNATVFLSMLVLGCTLAESPLRELLLGGKRVYAYLALRMLALPIVLILILKLFVRDPLPLGTLAILVSLPAGSMPLMLCQELGLEARELSRAIILSTLVCVLTIPVVCLFL